MAMVSMNSLLNGKDSRWLQLEVCREFQRNKCSRSDTECKFAHPPANVEVQNGRVTACYDSIKGRCNREKPPCKYFHPPQHLKDQLLINGRNHLALKNALMQQMGLAPGQVLPAQIPAVDCNVCDERWNLLQASGPYLGGVPAVGSGYSPYFTAGPLVPALVGHDPGAVPSGLAPALPPQVMPAQKLPRSDRLEMDMKTVGSFYYENFAFPGMVPYKRAAADKSGVPVYQPATTYQQLMQLQQPFVPVSCEYPVPATVPAPAPAPASPSPRPAAAAPPARTATSPPPPAAPLPPPTPSPDPATVAKEVAQSNYAAKLAAQAAQVAHQQAAQVQVAQAHAQVAQAQAQAQAHAQVAQAQAQAQAQVQAAQTAQAQAQAQAMHHPPPTSVSVSPITLSYTGVALSKQAMPPPRPPAPAPSPALLYRPPPSLLPPYPLLRNPLHSQLQSHLQSQLQSQIHSHLQAQQLSQLNQQLQSQSQLSGQPLPSAQSQLPLGGMQWSPHMLPPMLAPVPQLYQQQLLYQIPQSPVPTSTGTVLMNPYKKMKTT